MRDGPGSVFNGVFIAGGIRALSGAGGAGVHSVAPYSFRSATDESVQAIGLAL